MGLTDQERQWIYVCSSIHSIFCSCEDPLQHLTRCLISHTDEEQEAAEAMAAFGLGDTGDPATLEGDTENTGPGETR
ncbi:ORF2 [torque teno Delphinidae virus 6]